MHLYYLIPWLIQLVFEDWESWFLIGEIVKSIRDDFSGRLPEILFDREGEDIVDMNWLSDSVVVEILSSGEEFVRSITTGAPLELRQTLHSIILLLTKRSISGPKYLLEHPLFTQP